MTDQILNNEPASKPWWKSKTLWGLVITGISIAAPKYQPVAEVLPTAIDNVGSLVGLLLAAYGRIKADTSITK